MFLKIVLTWIAVLVIFNSTRIQGQVIDEIYDLRNQLIQNCIFQLCSSTELILMTNFYQNQTIISDSVLQDHEFEFYYTHCWQHANETYTKKVGWQYHYKARCLTRFLYELFDIRNDFSARHHENQYAGYESEDSTNKESMTTGQEQHNLQNLGSLIEFLDSEIDIFQMVDLENQLINAEFETWESLDDFQFESLILESDMKNSNGLKIARRVSFSSRNFRKRLSKKKQGIIKCIDPSTNLCKRFVQRRFRNGKTKNFAKKVTCPSSLNCERFY